MPPIALTSFQDFDTNRIRFSEPYTIYPRDDSMTSYEKVYIQVDEERGHHGADLILNTPPHLISFGIQEKKDRRTGDVIGYQVPLVLYNRKGATDEEKLFTTTLQNIVQKCQDHIHDYYDADPSKLNLLSWRTQENGDNYPLLYVKLITNRKTNRIMTLFINEDTNEEIDPADLINKRCLMTAALKFENLYVGDNVSIQLKLYEVLVKFIDRKKKNFYRPASLLRPDAQIGRRPVHPTKNKRAEEGPAVENQEDREPTDPTHDNPFSALIEEDEAPPESSD